MRGKEIECPLWTLRLCNCSRAGVVDLSMELTRRRRSLSHRVKLLMASRARGEKKQLLRVLAEREDVSIPRMFGILKTTREELNGLCARKDLRREEASRTEGPGA